METETRKRFNFIKQIGKLLVIFIFAGNSIAQDAHFSLFNSCPLFLNPAYTGNFTGDWRLALNFRNQWGAIEPFNTEMMSFDRKVYLFNQNFGAGLLFIGDQQGPNGLKSENIYGSFSYGRVFNNNFFNIGLQLGYVHQGFDPNQTYPDQYNRETGTFSPDINGSASKTDLKISYLDINLGILWKRSINIFEPEAGFSVFHLNSPNQSLDGGEDHLPLRFALNAKMKTKISDDYYVTPSLLYTRKEAATETMVGTNIGMNVFGNKSAVKEIFAGAYLRNGLFSEADALSILAGATIRNIEFALAYDISVSNLNVATNNRSAFEISIIYKSISTILNTYSIPCERY
jgi:type IX secretion system PorP/SprF family membrane protein